MIRIDQGKVKQVLEDFRNWVSFQIREYGRTKPINSTSNWNGDVPAFLTTIKLPTPWGEERTIHIAFLPSSRTGGGFGRLDNGSGVVKVFLGEYSWGTIIEPVILEKLNKILQHEITHAIDRVPQASRRSIRTRQNAKTNDASAVQELGIGPKAYFNDPLEVRAYMRQVYEEIAPVVRERMAGGMAHHWG